MPAFVRCTLLACALLCPLPAAADPLCVYVFSVSGGTTTPLAGTCDIPLPFGTRCEWIVPDPGEEVVAFLICVPRA